MNSKSSTSPIAPSAPRSRLAAWGIAGLLVVTTALSACGHRHHHRQDSISEERVTKMVDKVFSRVDATDAQKNEIAKIANQAVNQLKPMRQSVRQARAEAMSLLSAETIDRTAIDALRVEQMQSIEQASTIVSSALADIAQVLTPAQRLEVYEKLSERMNRHTGTGHSE